MQAAWRCGLTSKPEDLPSQFNAVLNGPILPPVRVVLRKTYTIAAKADAFVSVAPLVS